ncbi:NAD(P)-dependent methylenetetrahydromethanopterin dehydrogenase [Ancylobacter defluvii]|uniref:Methylenetetrahydromethanopterin dehydrogenase n=1 Tax=Ancylobacter defluvii TaxID=1282440 RepID=A0A9W6JYC2_9HYPH|nr:NAD(P)-dependent methylenetetrahydromethanopterin dehydrogenase [Ancylobacter defluvii]MBS7585970.1 methylenetetrahydromethanopterin dehydrogenase [Ancylobacter defluvii]GLK84350.1 methylenetetrahydromethanopterin dehydrogenase [Ancylobacter defluvii]
MADIAPILHIVSPLRHVSPFDVNMAVDAGYTTILPYSGVKLEEIVDLTQDMMFSRPPDHASRTGLFIGGKDASLALDMAKEVRSALFPPFQISVFVDPAGSFTTAAAMIAEVERKLRGRRSGGLKGAKVQVYGATGVVGGIAAVIAAQAGAEVTLVSHRDIDTVRLKAADFKVRFNVDLLSAVARDDSEKLKLLPEAEVVLACGKAGVQILTADHLAEAHGLLVAADVNAVPPSGIAGIDALDDGKPIGGGALGIGALAIGHLKYRVQHELLKRMRATDTALTIGFEDAFELARSLAI